MAEMYRAGEPAVGEERGRRRIGMLIGAKHENEKKCTGGVEQEGSKKIRLGGSTASYDYVAWVWSFRVDRPGWASV